MIREQTDACKLKDFMALEKRTRLRANKQILTHKNRTIPRNSLNTTTGEKNWQQQKIEDLGVLS